MSTEGSVDILTGTGYLPHFGPRCASWQVDVFSCSTYIRREVEIYVVNFSNVHMNTDMIHQSDTQ